MSSSRRIFFVNPPTWSTQKLRSTYSVILPFQQNMDFCSHFPAQGFNSKQEDPILKTPCILKNACPLSVKRMTWFSNLPVTLVSTKTQETKHVSFFPPGWAVRMGSWDPIRGRDLSEVQGPSQGHPTRPGNQALYVDEGG